MANGIGILFGIAVVLCMLFFMGMAANVVCKKPYVLEGEAMERGEIDCVPDRVGPKPEMEMELEIELEMEEVGSVEDMRAGKRD